MNGLVDLTSLHKKVHYFSSLLTTKHLGKELFRLILIIPKNQIGKKFYPNIVKIFYKILTKLIIIS
jgi:hypothetical protein